MRTDDEKLFPLTKYPKASAPEDTTTGEGAPDLELFITCVGYKDSGIVKPPHPGDYLFGLHAVCLRCVWSCRMLWFPSVILIKIVNVGPRAPVPSVCDPRTRRTIL